jgi:hypothetical protein
MSIVKPNCFEKTKEAWGIFSFFSSTNVETKNVCPIAYNGLYMKRSHARTLQLSSKLSGYVLYTVL